MDFIKVNDIESWKKYINMLFEKILITLFLVVLTYTFINISITIWLRFANPMNKISNYNAMIYLTFDDGINAQTTPMLLDLLKKHNIKATFFVVAQTLEENIEIVNCIKKEGHLIGLHSWSHKNQIFQDPFSLLNDFKKSIDIFKKHHITPAFYRPPWGHISLLGLYYCRLYNLNISLWNVIVQDWKKNTSPKIICNKLTEKVNGTAVICLHDGRGKDDAPKKTIEALCKMIPKWLEEGYSFETIDKLY